MKWKLLLATFSMALVLGACSGNNAPATPGTPDTGGSDGNGGSGNGNGNGGSGGDNGDNGGGNGGDEPIDRANNAYSDAEDAVMRAIAAARSATPATRAQAQKAIADARTALDEAVRLARAAVDAADDQDPAALGAATRALNRANSYKTNQNMELDTARASFAWYGIALARYAFPNGATGMQSATLEIKRIPRTVTVDGRVEMNTGQKEGTEAAFTISTSPPLKAVFKDVMYAAGKRVFSTTDDADGGDEFKVDGWVGALASNYTLDPYVHTGLKLTDTGLVIRTGGASPRTGINSPGTRVDFTDMRKNIQNSVNAGSAQGQNGWDLELTFGAPHTVSVPVGGPDSNHGSDWRGNGAFHWRSFIPAAESQLPGGNYYSSDVFKQPEGFRNLGTYDVWLSNHVGTNPHREPVPGSTAVCPGTNERARSCPQDDEPYYLKYAAYGLFVYAVDSETSIGNNWFNRINSIHFGYSAFANEDGRKTTDIGEAITSGKFHGHTIAYATQGPRGGAISKKLLRGDATLTVNIPKGTGSGTFEGTMNNFQSWNEQGNYWTDYCGHPACTGSNGITVTLNRVTISEDGTFIGQTRATPNNAFTTDTGQTYNSNQGLFKGSFYGPRADRSDLEVAGSWTLGKTYNWFDAPVFGVPQRAANQPVPNIFIQATLLQQHIDLVGSFGAKQRPVPGS